MQASGVERNLVLRGQPGEAADEVYIQEKYRFLADRMGPGYEYVQHIAGMLNYPSAMTVFFNSPNDTNLSPKPALITLVTQTIVLLNKLQTKVKYDYPRFAEALNDPDFMQRVARLTRYIFDQNQSEKGTRPHTEATRAMLVKSFTEAKRDVAEYHGEEFMPELARRWRARQAGGSFLNF